MRGISDSTLNSLWRAAVLKLFGGKCIICGQGPFSDNPLEAHHVNRRAHLTTRWDHRNGVPAHKYGCHNIAASKEGEAKIRIIMGDELYFELDRLARTTIKDYCQKTGTTKNEFKSMMKLNLLKLLEE